VHQACGFTRFLFSHEALGLLSEFDFGVVAPDNPRYVSDEYLTWLNSVGERLLALRKKLQLESLAPNLDRQSESVAVKEFFVLATLIYFERRSRHMAGHSSKVNAWVEEAFQVMKRIDHCNLPFPIFIIGLQLQTDDDKRQQLLELIDRSMKASNIYRLTPLRELLTTLWVQQDLNYDTDGYGITPCRILELCSCVPCLL
jgi:hypothetical protein